MSATVASPPPSRALPVAGASHTLVLLAVFFAMALAGALFQHAAHPARPPSAGSAATIRLYSTLLLMEWGLVLYVWRAGLRPRGIAVRDLIGGAGAGALGLARDAALAAAVWLGWKGFDAGWERLFGADHAASVAGLLPHGALPSLLWIAVSVSAGFGEEFVFRGYFQRQFAAWTGRAWLALVLQALVFGVSHGYQGVAACVRITLYGAMLGGIAMWRRSLRPGMIAHVMTDILAGLFRI